MKSHNRRWHLWQRISLRTKLTALSVFLIGVLLAVSSWGTLSLLKTYLQRNADTVLNSTVTSLSHEDPKTLQVRLTSGELAFPRLPSDYYIAYLDEKGGIIISLLAAATAKYDLPNLSAFTPSYVKKTGGLPFEVESTNKTSQVTRTWRMVAVPIVAETKGSLVVGLPTTSSDALLEQYQSIGFNFGLFLLIFSGLSIWFLITGALRPLREVERTAGAVSAGDISQRLVDRAGKTEISRINRSLNTMLNSIEDAMAARNNTLSQMRRFVADASHELRTPLVSVRGYAELYRMGALQKPEEVAEAMNRIESEAIRMGELVESLLTLARLDDGNQKTVNSVNLVSLARSAAKDASVADGGREVVLLDPLGIPLMPNAELRIEADANQMHQVMTNLLANASRFSPKGAKVEVSIGVPLGSKTGNVIIEVRDHGDGIPPELRDKVFERFFRADNSRNRETGGSGLGLAIVKSIVERHGGTIVADETPGGGATFRVELPAQQAKPAAAPTA
jgi:two-component system, OmpR family, sensor kinase